MPFVFPENHQTVLAMNAVPVPLRQDASKVAVICCE